MGPLHRSQADPCTGQLERQSFELLEVEGRQRFDPFGAVVGQVQPDDTAIFPVSGATDKARGVGAVNEAHRAVMAKEQIVGHLPDRRPTRICMAPDGKKELMLSGRESRDTSLLLAPAFEVAQTGPQREQARISRVRQCHSLHDIISIR
jgi:hypothetical protein